MREVFIKNLARSYVEERFTKASAAEKEKLVNDWLNKVENSRKLVIDFKRRIGDPRGSKVLDAGCGNGGLAIAFAEAGAEVYGVDIEKELVDIAKLHAQHYKVKPSFLVYDGDKLPFSNNTFFAAISASVLEHTKDPVAYLKEILRVLKPGGYLYLGLPNRLWPKETHTLVWGITYLPKKFADLVLRALKRCPLSENNLHFYTYWQIKKFISQAETQGEKFKIIDEPGASQNILKRIIKIGLKKLGLSYKAFLPHIQLVLVKKS